ncbi:MAG TPA: cyclic nucleotide-binding domain-containing protein [Rudaea sp.]|jgi:hypothetical protein|uniref:cyclic nucleotide-binding domain-containing protein n=1 Tax=Rudaea sp. TaxID=2136325 RepID=UPI002F94ED15
MSSIKDPFVEIGAGKTVFREGDAGAEMYIIESGQVELQSKARAGRLSVVLGPGDFFGADFLLDGKARSGTATVRENARLLCLTRSGLAEVIAQNPEIALGLLRRQIELQVENERHEKVLRAQLTSTVPEGTAAVARPAEAARSVPPAPPAPAVAPPPPPEPAPAPAQPPAAAAPASGYALRHILSGEAIALDPALSEFLVGRPDPATGSQPEIDLGPYDQNRNLSRRHARILHRDGVYCVREDSGTTNGTYVNGERLQTGVEVALKPGDKLRFGSIEVEFVSL